MRRPTFLGLLILVLAVGAGVAVAEEHVEITGDRISGDTRQQVTFIAGNVRIVQGSNLITADQGTMYLEEKRLFLKGQVGFDNPRTLIRAGYLEYDMRKKTGTFRERVVLQLEMKPTGQGVKKESLILCSDQLYFESNTKEIIAESGTFQHPDFSGGADRIEYHDALQQLFLVGQAYLKKAGGEEIRSQSIQIELDAKNFVAEKNVIISFEVDDAATDPPGAEGRESD